MTVQSNHIVILDFNAPYGDPTLRSGALNQLIRVCRVAQLPVFLPEAVILELVEQYKYTKQARFEAALTAVDKLNRYIYSGTAQKIVIDVHALVKQYESWLRRKLTELGIGVLQIPEITQFAVVRRATRKRRPIMGRDEPAARREGTFY